LEISSLKVYKCEGIISPVALLYCRRFKLGALLALNHFAVTLFLVGWGYVCAAWAFAIVKLAQGKRQAALDEEVENVEET